MAQFSGAVKLADLNDYLGPSQQCVKPLMKPKADEKKQDGKRGNKGSTVNIEVDADDARTLAATADSNVPIGVEFGQIKTDAIKKTATVSLNDCLACSGCVTSAETVLVQQQSSEQFFAVLDQMKRSKHGVVGMDTEESISADASEAKSDDLIPSVAIATVAPQVLTALADYYGLSLYDCATRLLSFLKSIGVDHLWDASTGLDIALLEARAEFVRRYKENQAAGGRKSNPILTSECPGWICYAEKTQGDVVLPMISSCKSPQQIMGAIAKDHFAAKLNIPRNAVFHTCLMPCYDKKLEGSRDDFFNAEYETRDVDCVLTTRELVDVLDARAVDLAKLQPSALDPQYFNIVPSNGTDSECELRLHSARDVGASGGYAENIFRFAAKTLFGRDLPDQLEYKQGRNADLKELTLEVDNQPVLVFLIAYGFRNIQNIVRRVKRKGSRAGVFHYAELMACPSGCLNGGGQLPYERIQKRQKRVATGQDNGADVAQPETAIAADVGTATGDSGDNHVTKSAAQKEYVSELDTLYHSRVVQEPEENPIVQRLYREWLAGAAPGTGKALEHLHTQYHAVEKADMNPLGIKW